MATLHNINDILFSVNEFVEKFSFNKTFLRLYNDLSSVNDKIDTVQTIMDSTAPTANTSTVGYVTYNSFPVSAYSAETASVLSLSALSTYIENSLMGSFSQYDLTFESFNTPNISSGDITLSGAIISYAGATTLPTGLTIETGIIPVSGDNGPSSTDVFDVTPRHNTITVAYEVPFKADTPPNVFIQIIDNTQTTVTQSQYIISPSDRQYQYSITSSTCEGFMVDVFYKTDNLSIASIESGNIVYPGFAINWCAIGVK